MSDQNLGQPNDKSPNLKSPNLKSSTPRRLSPWNPLDHMRLLWWMLVTPQQLVIYRRFYGENAERDVGIWLFSIFVWLPLILISAAQWLGTIPRSKPPLVYLCMSIGWALLCMLTGLLVGKKTPVVDTVTSFAKGGWYVLLPFLVAIFVAYVVLRVVMLFGINIGKVAAIIVMVMIFGSLGFRGEGPHIGVVRSGKPAIALKVEVKALEESCDLENAVATPLDRFDLIVQAFHETTTETVHKVVDDFIQPIVECRQELVEAI